MREARFRNCAPPEPSDAATLIAYLPESADGAASSSQWSFSLLPAASAAGISTADGRVLRGWKRLCDELLPELRARGHLYNLLYRHKTNCSLVLTHAGTVVGGTTLRMILDRTDGRSGGGCVVLDDVLTLAVDQRRGVCGHGHGTRLVNGLKALLAARAASMRVTSAVLCMRTRASGVREARVREYPHGGTRTLLRHKHILLGGIGGALRINDGNGKLPWHEAPHQRDAH